MTRLLIVGAVLVASGCTRKAEAPAYPQAVEAAGLHNVFRLSDKLYCGSVPEGDEGFDSLAKLGVKSVLTVDGAKPDVERARRFGMRYVHLPVGYDGVGDEQGRKIARAVRDLEGPVYLHCHHGKHRAPAAAAVAMRCLDGRCTAEKAAAWLKLAGTDPRYAGLHAAPGRFEALTEAELDAVRGNFPEVAAVPKFAELMVGVDEHWENLTLARKAGWKAPPGHPDVVPANEAVQLREAFREAGRMRLADEFRGAEAVAGELERAIRAGKADAAEAAYQKAKQSCATCHAKHRDAPKATR